MPRPAKRAERYAHPYNAAITMYRGRRADSPYWEAQFKMPDGKLLYRATGVSDKSQAEKIAYDRYQETMKAVSEGRGVGLRKFRTAAELTIKALDAELEASGLVGTEAHKITKHITTIRNHLLPKFGELPLAGITERDVDAYAASLKGRNGQKAAKSTISNHNHSLQLVFRTALKEGWVSKADVKRIRQDGGEAPVPRAVFELSEFKKLLELTDAEWIASGKTEKCRQTRQVLRDLIVVVGSTGIRPGTEAFSIRKTDLDFLHMQNAIVNGSEVLNVYTVISLTRRRGKTKKSRQIVCYSWGDLLRHTLERMRVGRDSKTSIFARHCDGKVPSDLHGVFETLLDENNLLFDRDGDRRSLYSLRHFYAIQRLQEKCSYELLSKQMGTSVDMLERFYSSRFSSVLNASVFSLYDFEKLSGGEQVKIDDKQI